MTFTIVVPLVDGRWAAATATFPAEVGWTAHHGVAGVGIAVVQARNDPAMGRDVLSRMAKGESARAAMDRVRVDDHHWEERQVVVGHVGRRFERSCVHDGNLCTGYKGVIRGRDGCIVIGNTLESPDVLDNVSAAWMRNEGVELNERLCLALEAGRDGRGLTSAAITTVGPESVLVNRVDFDPRGRPIRKLRDQFPIPLPTHHAQPEPHGASAYKLLTTKCWKLVESGQFERAADMYAELRSAAPDVYKPMVDAEQVDVLVRWGKFDSAVTLLARLKQRPAWLGVIARDRAFGGENHSRVSGLLESVGYVRELESSTAPPPARAPPVLEPLGLAGPAQVAPG